MKKAPPGPPPGDDNGDGPDLFNWRGKSLTQARKEYWEDACDDGVECPCCDRFGRVYRRRLNSGMAWWLIRFYRYCEVNEVSGEFVDVRGIPGGIEQAHKCEFEKLFYWGLVEPDPTSKEEGHRSGFWRITQLGRSFVMRRAVIPSHALDYDGRCLGMEGKLSSITDALKSKFNYHELMEWKPGQ